MKKYIIINFIKLFFFSTFILSGCIKTQTKAHRDLLTRKDGVWKVDKFTVNWFSPSGEFASKTEIFENQGEIIFEKKGEDVTMTYTGTIQIDNSSYGPFYDIETDITGSTLSGLTYYDIVYLDKKKMRLFVPRLTNSYWTQFYDYSFYIECSKK